jgi:hypothetical protein
MGKWEKIKQSIHVLVFQLILLLKMTHTGSLGLFPMWEVAQFLKDSMAHDFRLGIKITVLIYKI